MVAFRVLLHKIFQFQVVKMFILVVLIFGLCWLPYHGYFIYVYYDTKVIFSKYTQHVYLSFYWLAMSNAMVNPLIYYWMNARLVIFLLRNYIITCLHFQLFHKSNEQCCENSSNPINNSICKNKVLKHLSNCNNDYNSKILIEMCSRKIPVGFINSKYCKVVIRELFEYSLEYCQEEIYVPMCSIRM